MAERGGFEPPVRFYPYNGLANRRIRPLCHLSKLLRHSCLRLSRNAAFTLSLTDSPNCCWYEIIASQMGQQVESHGEG
jgi:hypothetical protein